MPPAELESLLLQHPDTEATELPRTYIVPVRTVAKKTTSFAQGIQEWVARKVFPHKKLRGGIVLVGHIPGSALGKILRRELRARVASDMSYGQVGGRAKL